MECGAEECGANFHAVLKYAIIVKANSFYDSGTSYLFAVMLLRYDFDLFFT